MKKIIVILLIIPCFLFCGCKMEDPKYIHFQKKPKVNYYSSEICSLLLEKNDYTLTLFDTNLCNDTELTGDDKKFIIYFLNEIKEDNYISKDDERISSLKREPYEMKITFDSGKKYIIKIYSPSIVSIIPWDGIFEDDYIDTESISLKYNPYEFSEFIKRRSQNNYTN